MNLRKDHYRYLSLLIEEEEEEQLSSLPAGLDTPVVAALIWGVGYLRGARRPLGGSVEPRRFSSRPPLLAMRRAGGKPGRRFLADQPIGEGPRGLVP